MILSETVQSSPQLTMKESLGASPTDTSFFEINPQNIRNIAGIEKNVWGYTASKNNDSYYHDKLDLPGFKDFSFLLGRENNRGVPLYSGYCLAYLLPDDKGQERTLYVEEVGVLPGRAESLGGIRIFKEVLDRAKAYGIEKIKFEAREDTTYKAIVGKWLSRMILEEGYTITDNGPYRSPTDNPPVNKVRKNFNRYDIVLTKSIS